MVKTKMTLSVLFLFFYDRFFRKKSASSFHHNFLGISKITTLFHFLKIGSGPRKNRFKIVLGRSHIEGPSIENFDAIFSQFST